MNSLRLASRVVGGTRQSSTLRSLAAASSSAVSRNVNDGALPAASCRGLPRASGVPPRRQQSSSTTVTNAGLPVPLPFKESK